MRDFSKTHQSSLTLKGGSTSHLGLLPSGKKRKPPYSVLKPLRYKVGGPSEVFASSRAAFCGMRPHGHESLTSCRKAMKPNTASSMIEITQHALKGQKLLAQGTALGIMSVSNAPCKGKSFKIHLINIENPLRYVKLLPLQGALFATHQKPRVLPWAKSFCPFYYICTWKNKEVKIFISANYC